MKVAMVDPSAFTPPYDHHLCAGLAETGCELTLFTTDSDYFLWDGDTSYRRLAYFYSHTNDLYSGRDVSFGRTVVKGTEHIVDMSLFVRKIRAMDPDVVHFQWLPLPIVDRLFLQALRRVAPLVLTVHDTTPFRGASTSPIQLLGAESVYELFDQLIVHTPMSQDELVAQNIRSRDISIIPHGILQYPPQPSETEDTDTSTILFFGTIKPYKNIETLLEAYAELPADIRETVELHIAGSPKMDVRPLRERATALGVQPSVHWDLRFVPDAEVPGLFSDADLIVFPYDDIDQSGALLTALQYETPIVATDIAGFASVLTDGKHGYLVPPKNSEELSDAMNRILSDTELAARMSENIGDLVESIPSWVDIARRTCEVYRSVV
ncbi:glycosyltransferase family 4 protein [Haloplanus salinus]|jgi:glycosyltransferase involved in cell wall biosynthesis|nr:glycosyltransferase family 4 protein [Haloplanus salinus]